MKNRSLKERATPKLVFSFELPFYDLHFTEPTAIKFSSGDKVTVSPPKLKRFQLIFHQQEGIWPLKMCMVTLGASQLQIKYQTAAQLRAAANTDAKQKSVNHG